MWYVYILRSISFPTQEYTGATADLKERILDHNAGKSTHTSKFKPWELVWYCAFSDKHKALEFERYLKSHCGRAFARKRLLQLEHFRKGGHLRAVRLPPHATNKANLARAGAKNRDLISTEASANGHFYRVGPW